MACLLYTSPAIPINVGAVVQNVGTAFAVYEAVQKNKPLFERIVLSLIHILEFAKMTDIIKHRGIVENIEGSHVRVRIVQTSACSACSVKGHCNASESKEKLIDVFDMKASSCLLYTSRCV